MNINSIKLKKYLKIFLLSIVGIILLLIVTFLIYTSIYYKADDYAQYIILENNDRIVTSDNLIIFHPEEENNVGLIFYPGGKVEGTAYSPLLKALSDNGITVVLVEMPFNLAVFGVNSADAVFDMFPNIQNWYIGGHSLGGAMASSYANNNIDKLQGLILLGAYPVQQIELDTLTIYGSEDNIINSDRLEEVEDKIKIDGGNHSNFGNYGEQSGDGVPTITREEQHLKTIELILEFIN